MARISNRNRNRRASDTSDVVNFGDVLRDTREKHGISLSEVSQELRVREDILVAIESGDFSKIPPQGYSRNMIKSYSRLLGLNANKITDMFLDAEYSYQLSKKRTSAQNISAENKKRVPDAGSLGFSGSRTPRQQLEFERKNKAENKTSKEDDNNNSPFGKRTMHVYGNRYKNTPRARREQALDSEIQRGRKVYRETKIARRDLVEGDDYRTAKTRLEARKASNLYNADNNKGDINPFSAEGRKRRTQASGLRGRQKINRTDSARLSDEENPNSINRRPPQKNNVNFMNVYQNKNNAAQSRFTIPIIAGAVIILIIVLILVFFLVGKQQENDKTDVSKLNVVGISDIENNGNNQENNTNNNEVKEAPKEIEFKYKVKDGQSVYIEIYENNSATPTLARSVNGGETDTYKVTDTLKFVTTSPDAVDITVNNEVVKPADANGTGVYTYTVNYNEYMNQYKTKNLSGTNNTQNQSSSNSSSSTSGSSSSSSSSSTNTRRSN